MKTRLFKEDSKGRECYTEDSLAFSKEFQTAIRPIIDKWIASGYSIRDLHYVAKADTDEAFLIRMI